MKGQGTGCIDSSKELRSALACCQIRSQADAMMDVVGLIHPGQGISTTQMAGLEGLANERISSPWSCCWTPESCDLSVRGLLLVIRYVLVRIGLTRQAGPAGRRSVPQSHHHWSPVRAGTFKGRTPVFWQYRPEIQRPAPHPCSLLLMRCAAMRCDAGVCMVNQQVIKGDLKRARVVEIAITQPTSSAGVQGPSGNMLLLLENAPSLSDPGPCPCLSGLLFDTNS